MIDTRLAIRPFQEGKEANFIRHLKPRNYRLEMPSSCGQNSSCQMPLFLIGAVPVPPSAVFRALLGAGDQD